MGPGAVKDAVSGNFLGHPLDPLLTDLPIGSGRAPRCSTSSVAASQEASERLIAVGIAAAVPTAVTGTSEWADTTPADASVRRISAVHALSDVTALALYGASLASPPATQARQGSVARARRPWAR